MESTGDNSENIAEDQPESWENSAEDVVSTHSRKHPFDPLGKDHLILEVLGQGTFGQVVKCYNSKNDTFEAVKILKSHADVITLADREVRILKRLQCLDPEKSHIVKFNNFFFDKEGICLSFEPLDLDLFTYIYDVKGPPLNRGLALSEVRAITHQLATALHHLRTIDIIHGDIKPNNIMVVNRQEEPLKVKLGDFSTAQFCGNIDSNISPRTSCYSSPEVLLNCPFDEAIDMWSLGITLVVAALGTSFIPHNNTYDMLKFIINIMGQPPDHVLDNGSTTQDFFNEDINTNPKWTIKTVEQYEQETGTTALRYLDEGISFDDIKDEIISNIGAQSGVDLFLDLIQKMLDVDPEKRIMPLEVLLHPFFAVTEEKTEKDMGLSDQSSCFCREEEEDQARFKDIPMTH
ncbi:Homeodomain-interacting protein kinase 2 [Takifugu flavidus]|uniref:Homeodomain-interacting protein kinase 2 n=1 Tax=Takifugu flavidus TaxID=433684 RepID=A0A5C6PJV6_9TELE|nr:Homeodomain-interacting protein kinase 2 [Takifugu flavidus]